MKKSILMYSVLYLLEVYPLPLERGIMYKVHRTLKAVPVHTLKSHIAVKL